MDQKVIEKILYIILGIVILVALDLNVVEIPKLFEILLGTAGFAVITMGLFELHSTLENQGKNILYIILGIIILSFTIFQIIKLSIYLEILIGILGAILIISGLIGLKNKNQIEDDHQINQEINNFEINKINEVKINETNEVKINEKSDVKFKYCPECGKEISIGAKHCTHCGKNLDLFEI